MFDMMQRAEDLSRLYEPPRWRIFRYRHWRNHQQPHQVAEMLVAALLGDHEPIRKEGRSV